LIRIRCLLQVGFVSLRTGATAVPDSRANRVFVTKAAIKVSTGRRGVTNEQELTAAADRERTSAGSKGVGVCTDSIT